MNTEFTKQDVDVLFEAVEKWEQDDMGGEIMGAMFEGLFIDKASPEAIAKMEAEREERGRKKSAARRQRKERGVLLRAKLVMIKDAIEADDFKRSV